MHIVLASALILPAVVLLGFYIYFKLFSSKYWAKRNVPHLEPVFFLGNMWKTGIFEDFITALRDCHLRNKKSKILGFWMFTKPALLIMDLDIIKRILIKDFNSFRDRGIEVNTDLDPLAGHLFMLSGKKWRNLRVRLTPTFTTGKMKLMFPTVVGCGQELNKYIAELKGSVEVKDLMARFSTDVIASCAFGLDTKTIRNPKSEFREFGKKAFKVDLRMIIVNIIIAIYPELQKLLKIRLVPKDVSDFFLNIVKDNIEYREKTSMKRNDFLQLLIQLMRAGKIEDVDKTPIDEMGDEEIVRKFSLNEAAAQCFVFFVAGFETSATALTFALYELALNSDILTKLQDDIETTIDKHGGELSFEAMTDMEYLDMFVQETLRKYPPVSNLQRQALVDYEIPELGVTIEKGTIALVAVNGIHEDPNNYPEPQRFDPERFSAKEKRNRHICAYLPFGEGPRNCIGNRFGLMQIKVALISILREYNVQACKETPIPVVYEIKSFMPYPKGGMPLVFVKRD